MYKKLVNALVINVIWFLGLLSKNEDKKVKT